MKARYRWNLLKSISVKINNDKVQCLVCNKFFSALAPHLSKTHGKTTEWYRTKYDNAPTVSESYRSGLSNTKREQSAAFTPEQRKAWGDRISKQMHAYFDRMTPEEYETYVEQQVAAMTSPDARVNGLRAFKARATKEEWAAHRKNLSEKTKARFARMSEEEIREFIRKSRMNQQGTSGPEKRLVKKLRKLGFEVQAQHKIDRFQVDAFLPEEGIVVELYGDYWHANPERYEPDFVHPTTGLTAKETWKRDRKRARKIEKLGYKVMVIWEREMKTLSSSDLKRKLLDGNTEPSRSRK